MPRSGVNPTQHLSLLVATPVGACHGLELDGLLRKGSRAIHVGSGAQVPPGVVSFANVVDCDGFCFDAFEDLGCVGRVCGVVVEVDVFLCLYFVYKFKLVWGLGILMLAGLNECEPRE
jgi:hypothetical protein